MYKREGVNFKKFFNNDIIYTMINQLWRLVSGPMTLIMIPLFLSAEIQGYWYTFISISALAIFADLGFANIVLQFSAHEFAFLRFNEKGEVEGDAEHINKLASFFVFSLKWVMAMILIAFPLILSAGIFIFSEKHENINWFLPWILYLVGSTISFFNNMIISFLQGCNLVGKIQRISFIVSVFYNILIWGCLFFKLQLYSIAIGLIVSSLFINIILYKDFKVFIRQLLKVGRSSKYSWKKDFLNLLWKYAISFASGYFIFQIYTPLTFKYHGAVEAGKVGLSMSLWTAIFQISNIFVTVYTPKINMLVSKKDWKNLDDIFKKVLLISCFIFALGMISVVLILMILKGKVSIISRFLDLIPMITLGMCWLLQMGINTTAVYLRAHKEEPLVLISVISSIYILITTWLSAKYLSNNFFFIGFLSSYLFGVPVIGFIFFKKKKEWHNGKIVNDCNTNI